MGYRNIVLVTRNAECGNLTPEEFVKMMFNDVLEAVDKYDDMCIHEYIENEIKFVNDCISGAERRAKAYAEKKWKTEKKRTEYVTKEVSAMRKKMSDRSSGYYYGITFFDFDVNPGSNGLSGNCCLNLSTLTPEALVRCFNEVKDNKYFKAAHGWTLEYKASENSYRNSFRPQIKLIVDADVEAQMKADAKALEDAIAEFYRNCSYPGD